MEKKDSFSAFEFMLLKGTEYMQATSKSFVLTDNEKVEIVTYYSQYEQLGNTTAIERLFILPHCRITIYKTKKILFQGRDAEKEYAKWRTDIAANQQPQSTHALPENSDSLPIHIGCDETGVGDYLAPLVTACCYITPEIKQQLTSLPIQDSKQLLDKNIIIMAETIKRVVPHAITTLTNQHYNNFIDNGFNAHAVKAFLHNKTLGHLFTKYPSIPQTAPIIMDQFASKKNYTNYLVSKKITPIFLPTHFETKAENKFFAVACASILARAHFLVLMEKQNQQYDMVFPLGAGAQVDACARSFLQKYGETELKKVVKWHFANTKKLG